ncbi:MAG: hypothetical protein AAB217_09580, partial [Chloroflexota bacterium]
MKPKLNSLIAFSLAVLLLLTNVFAVSAETALPDGNTAGIGILELRSGDHEHTISFEGAGYNLHRFSALRLSLIPGVYHFDYWCDGRDVKHFSGGVPVAAWQVTTVTLAVEGCETLSVSQRPGQPIAFESTRDGNREIYFANADGSGLSRLTKNSAYDEDPSWSADGTRLAFSAGCMPSIVLGAGIV